MLCKLISNFRMLNMCYIARMIILGWTVLALNGCATSRDSSTNPNTSAATSDATIGMQNAFPPQ